MAESYGIMVNYVYDLASIEANHEAFVRDGIIARSDAVDALLTDPATAPRPRLTAALAKLRG
jgi:malonyl-CoA decarboxylase